jgi:hypothetical protein
MTDTDQGWGHPGRCKNIGPAEPLTNSWGERDRIAFFHICPGEKIGETGESCSHMECLLCREVSPPDPLRYGGGEKSSLEGHPSYARFCPPIPPRQDRDGDSTPLLMVIDGAFPALSSSLGNERERVREQRESKIPDDRKIFDLLWISDFPLTAGGSREDGGKAVESYSNQKK